MPMVPLGCAVQIFKNPTAEHRGQPTPSVGGIWERPPRTIVAIMYGAEKQVPKKVSDTVYFKHTYITIPTVIPEYAAVQAA